MSNWIKLDDDTFAEEASPDPRRIVKISELEAEIGELQRQIDSVVLLDYPEGASDDLRRAVDLVNEEKDFGKQSLIFAIEEKQKILNEINADN